MPPHKTVREVFPHTPFLNVAIKLLIAFHVFDINSLAAVLFSSTPPESTAVD